MSKSRFYNGFPYPKPVFICHGISLDNEKQIKANYRVELAKLLNKHIKRIDGFFEFVGDELFALQNDLGKILKKINLIPSYSPKLNKKCKMRLIVGKYFPHIKNIISC